MREKTIREIQELAKEAYNPIGLQHYNAERQEWDRNSTSGSSEVKMATTNLKKGKIEPLFRLIKNIDKRISHYENDLPSFFEDLYSYTNYLYGEYGNNALSHHISPQQIFQSHMRAVARLKEISASLKEKMVFNPCLEFEKRLEKNDSESGGSLEISTLDSNANLLRKIKNYAVTYQMNCSQESAFFNEIQRLFLEAFYEVELSSTCTSQRLTKVLRDNGKNLPIKEVMFQLKEGNLDPAFSLLRQIDAEVDEAAKFAIREDYEQISKLIKLPPIMELEQINQSGIQRLKEISALLKAKLVYPSLHFLEVRDANKQKDPLAPNPAHLFFQRINNSGEGANHYILQTIMAYAGFFKMHPSKSTHENEKLIEKGKIEPSLHLG